MKPEQTNINSVIPEIFCEYRKNPIGIGTQTPRLTWRLPSDSGIGRQQQYRVQIATSSDLLIVGKPDIWDSGMVSSTFPKCRVEAADRIVDRTGYYYQVTLWCEGRTEPLKSDIGYFETAILQTANWHAAWIQHPNPTWGVSPLFRKTVVLEKTVKKARAYFCGLGYGYLYINGKQVSDSCLDPGWTDYRKRILYRVFDITPYLTKGENVIAVSLGEGWYGHDHPSIRTFTGGLPLWHGTPKMLLEMDITFYDDTLCRVITGENQGFLTTEGPVRKNSIYDGELFDARLNPVGWQEHQYYPSADRWVDAVSLPLTENLIVQEITPIRRLKAFQPISVKKLSANRYLYDFGQNLSGWAAVSCKGERGSSITLYYAETVAEDGGANQQNLRGSKSRDKYILCGDENERYETAFTYHGFRYLEIQSEGIVEISEVEAFLVASDIAQTGNFSCSDNVLCGIQNALIWTEKTNMISIPTDCPQRDERMAWLNDMTVRCDEAFYNFDVRLFYEKWMEDIADAQLENGGIPDTAPYVYGGYPALHVSSCIILIPWLLYLHTGEIDLIQTHYDRMKRYVLFLRSQTEDGVISDTYFGDWAPPEAECIQGEGWNAIPNNITRGVVSTGYLYLDCQLMKEMAPMVGRAEDVALFEEIAAEVKEAINRHFYDSQTGNYGTGSQGSNIFPLLLHLAEEGEHKKVMDNLLRDVEAHGNHVTTGNQMTKYLFDLLMAEGQNGLAFKLAQSITYPSIGYMLTQGATTVWERWENLTGPGMNSHNHPMLGAFTVWFYKAVGGIRFESEAGNRKIVLAPDFSLPLEHAAAHCQTLTGRLGISWKKSEGEITVEVEVPWNEQCFLTLPDREVCLETGKHCLRFAEK